MAGSVANLEPVLVSSWVHYACNLLRRMEMTP